MRDAPEMAHPFFGKAEDSWKRYFPRAVDNNAKISVQTDQERKSLQPDLI